MTPLQKADDCHCKKKKPIKNIYQRKTRNARQIENKTILISSTLLNSLGLSGFHDLIQTPKILSSKTRITRLNSAF